MNLFNYLNTLDRLYSNCDGHAVSRFLSLDGNHILNPNLNRIEHPEASVERQIGSPLDEVIIAHIKVLFHLNENRKITN